MAYQDGTSNSLHYSEILCWKISSLRSLALLGLSRLIRSHKSQQLSQHWRNQTQFRRLGKDFGICKRSWTPSRKQDGWNANNCSKVFECVSWDFIINFQWNDFRLIRRMRPVFLDRMSEWQQYAATNEHITGGLEHFDLFYVSRREAESHCKYGLS